MSLATHIRNYFSSGQSINPAWGSEVQSLCYLSTPSDGETYLTKDYPMGNVVLLNSTITGDIVFETEMKLENEFPEFQAIAIDLLNVNPKIDITWSDGSCYFQGGIGEDTTITNSFFDWSVLKSIKFKIVRTSGVVTLFYYNSGWVDSGVSGSYSGSITSVVITSGVDNSGFKYFDFEADAGLPYPLDYVTISQLSGQLSGQLTGQS